MKANLLNSLIDIPYEGQNTDVQTQDDATLVALAITEGPRAFGAIVERYQDAVFGIALSRLRNFHDAEDLTQTTFVEAFDRLDRLKEPEGLGPWLRTIAINRCINYLKRRERQVDFDAIDEPVSDKPSPEVDVEQAELREQVMVAVGRLSKTQRETVTLFYIGDYSLAAVASIQGVPLGTIKRRLHEARKRLKEDMMDMVEDVLKDNAPDENMADRVFNLLCAYPSGSRFFNKPTIEALKEIGEAGKEGFDRIFDLPHSRSRATAVHYLGSAFKEEDGPLRDMAIDYLKKALDDSNRGVRSKAVVALLFGGIKISADEYTHDIMPLVIRLLSDSSKRTRRAVLFSITWWAHKFSESKSHICEALPLDQICRAMVQEKDPENIRRFQLLIDRLLDAQEG